VTVFTDDDENSAPDFVDDVGEEEYDAVCCAKNGEEYDDEALCAECGHSVLPGSGRFANRVLIFDSYATRRNMGYPYPEGAYLCAECEQAINEKCAAF
jgi:hypothetical protein